MHGAYVVSVIIREIVFLHWPFIEGGSNKQNKPPSLGLMGANRSEDRRAKTFDSRINSLLLLQLYYSMSAVSVADVLGARFCRYELIQSLKRYIGNSAELFLTNTIKYIALSFLLSLSLSLSLCSAERKNVRGKRRGLAASCDAKRYKVCLYLCTCIECIYARTCGDYLFYADSHDAPSSRRRYKRIYTSSNTLYSDSQTRELSIFATLYTSLRFHSARYICICMLIPSSR
uniref:Uncharacterized protein n=1 Tax=Trichogramma kaykai TaxID=54128 RepID=A0ABD2VUP9_9HYME